jgi:hypothetical protein
VTSWGGHKQSALRLAERGLEAFEAGLGPELAGVVVILKGRRSLWQLEPLRFPSGVDVHVGLQGAGLVERSDAHEPDIGPASVVAPDRGLTHGAAVDVVRTVLARHRNGYRLAAEQLDRLSLDDCVEYERTARQPLAVVAMTAVDEHWLVEELVAYRSASAAAGDLPCHGEDPIEANSSLVVRAYVLPHLVMPVGPFVPALWAPVVQMMSDAAVLENLRHSVGRPAVLPWTAAGHESDVASRVLMEKPWVILVSHIVDRVIEVKIVVVHPVHRVPHVVDARERVTALHVVGMLEESVGRVIGTERCAQRGDPDTRRLALGVDKRKNFVSHIGVVLRLHPAPVERVRSLICERIALHAVDAEDSDAPLFQVRAESANHALAFHFPLVAAARREGEDGCAVIAVNGDAHVAIETVRVPTLMITMHAVRG